ncbi:helix-turn-helix transcriptional regulator [Mesorhizobium sp. CAU 1741]|uniref:AraC family transcriptional regulator n=1 Tax=Mesorhizobium sp. CAU 1741 TaxID=3140366 RepID=UPI00325A4CC6
MRRRLDRIEAARGDVIAVASDYPDGFRVNEHRHSRGQLLHALSGVVMISTREGRWMVPPDHAMWIPAGVDHAVEMLGPVRMRSAYVLPGSAAGLPGGLRVLAMSDLMRGLVVEAVEFALDAADARSTAIMRLILLEIPRLEERPLTLPFPADPRLARLCRRFVEKPSSHAGIDDWAARAGMSRRSFTRAFQRETGLSLSVWRRQATLFAALPRLAEGASVTNVALDLGYESAPAFTTMFRRMLGTPPRSYMRRSAAREPFKNGEKATI